MTQIKTAVETCFQLNFNPNRRIVVARQEKDVNLFIYLLILFQSIMNKGFSQYFPGFSFVCFFSPSSMPNFFNFVFPSFLLTTSVSFCVSRLPFFYCSRPSLICQSLDVSAKIPLEAMKYAKALDNFFCLIEIAKMSSTLQAE